MNTLVLSFLQVTRATTKALMSLSFGPTPSPTMALAALQHLKIDVQSCDHSRAFILDWIFFILTGNEDKIEFEFHPALT